MVIVNSWPPKNTGLPSAVVRKCKIPPPSIWLLDMRHIPKLEKLTVSFSRSPREWLEMTDVLAVRDEYRAQNWAVVIQKCSSNGLSNREFCRQQGISEKTHYYWLRKLRSQMAEAAVPQLVQLESAPVPIQDDMLQIQYRGAELKLLAGVDMDTVVALLQSLQSL